MLTLHHLENSRSQRILWLLEELEVSYEIERYERNPKTQFAPESLKQVHPLGRSPVITDGNQVIAESGAIIEYLLAKHDDGAWQPSADDEAFWRFKFWMHYAEGSLMPLLLVKLILSRFSQSPVPLVLRPVGGLLAGAFDARFSGPRIAESLDFVEATLEQSTWFAGESLSAADVQMSFPLEAADSRDLIGDERPQTLAFLERIHARPAYQRALEKGGPYAYA